MRVLHFGKFTHHQAGGIERHVAGLTAGLASAGVHVVDLVYDVARQGGAPVIDGVRVHHVPCYGRPASLPIAPSTYAVARRIVREASIDIVHLHFPDPLADIVSAWLPKRVRRVASWHSDIVRQRTFGALYRTFQSHALRPLDAVIGATPRHVESSQIDRRVAHASRYVVPYGIDTAPLRPTPQIIEQARAHRARRQGRPIVFALGRHVYYKGFDVLIDAMRAVDAVLILGGDGPITADLRQRVRQLELEHRVEIMGSIPESDLAAYFHACDVFCLPSTEIAEAFGLVQGEAMACGKPVVNCALGNGVNFVSIDGETGLTVPPRDADALARALNRLIADPEFAASLGEAGRRRVAEMFSMDAMVAKTLRVYERTLASRSPGS